MKLGLEGVFLGHVDGISVKQYMVERIGVGPVADPEIERRKMGGSGRWIATM